MSFQRVESTFAPVPDGTYTLYPVEATFVISSKKGTPGVNFKFKVNDLDEAAQPQKNAGRTFFDTSYLTEKTVGNFCQLLDMMGFRTNEKGLYLLPSGELMPDFLKMEDKQNIGFLVGQPFVAKLSSKEEEYEDAQGKKKPKTSYSLFPNWIIPPDGGRKVMQLSAHQNKAAAFGMAAAGQMNPTMMQSTYPGMTGGAAPNQQQMQQQMQFGGRQF